MQRWALPPLSLLWREGVGRHMLLVDSSFLFLCKLVFKVFLLAFILIVARCLDQGDFGDFQFVSAIVNLCSQPTLLFTIIVARVGCSFPTETQGGNLRWYFQRRRRVLWGGAVAVWFLFFVLGVWLAPLAKIEAQSVFFLAGSMVVAAALFNYYLGFLQSLERFVAIGLLFVLLGVANLLLGLGIPLLGLGLQGALGVQALATVVGLAACWRVVDRILPRQPISPRTRQHALSRSHLWILAVVLLFYLTASLDVLVVKVLYSRVQAGHYLRLELLGKILFLLASSLGMVIFPLVMRAAQEGRDTRNYLVQGSLYFCLVSLLLWSSGLFFRDQWLELVFGTKIGADWKVVGLLIGSRVFQAYILMLIYYGAVFLERLALAAMLGMLVGEALLLWQFHDSLLAVAFSSAAASLAGAVFLLWLSLQVRSKVPTDDMAGGSFLS